MVRIHNGHPDGNVVEIVFKILAYYGIDLYDDVQRFKKDIACRWNDDIEIAISLCSSNEEAELIREIYHAIWMLENYRKENEL